MTGEDPNAPKWEHRSEFKIHSQMRSIVKLTIEAAENELAATRRKLEKLTYGG